MAKKVFRVMSWILVICGALPLVGIIIIFLLHPMSLTKGVPDELNWISLLAAVVGCIGAIGGIVVGMISLITLSQIGSQVKSEFDERYEEHKKELNKQSSQWATGIKLWTRATLTTDPLEAAGVMEQALKAWPSAPGARMEILNKLYKGTEEAYLLDLVPERRKILEQKRFLPSQYTQIKELPESNLSEVIQWWTLANEFESEEDPVYLDYLGSKINAMCHRFDRMLELLQKAGNYQTTNQDIIIWCSAAQDISELRKLVALLCSLGVPAFILSAQQIINSLKEVLNQQEIKHFYYFAYTAEYPVITQREVIKVEYNGKWNIQYMSRHGDNKIIESEEEMNTILSPFRFVGPMPDYWL